MSLTFRASWYSAIESLILSVAMPMPAVNPTLTSTMSRMEMSLVKWRLNIRPNVFK